MNQTRERRILPLPGCHSERSEAESKNLRNTDGAKILRLLRGL